METSLPLKVAWEKEQLNINICTSLSMRLNSLMPWLLIVWLLGVNSQLRASISQALITQWGYWRTVEEELFETKVNIPMLQGIDFGAFRQAELSISSAERVGLYHTSIAPGKWMASFSSFTSAEHGTQYLGRLARLGQLLTTMVASWAVA